MMTIQTNEATIERNATSQLDFESVALNQLRIMQEAFRPAGGFIELRTLDEIEKSHAPAQIFLPVTAEELELRRAVKWLTQESGKGRGAFIGVNPRVDGEGGGKSSVKALTTIFADIDNEKLSISTEEAIAEIEELSPIPPDLVINSGGGLHVYYFIQPTEDVDAWLAVQTALYEKFRIIGADKAVVADTSRILRLTPFVNWKYERENGGRATRIIRFTSRDTGAPSIAVMTELFEAKRNFGKDDERESKFVLPESIGDGERNHTLFRQASRLRNSGFEYEEILASIEKINEMRCVPPLEDDELQRIAESAMRYEPKYEIGGGRYDIDVRGGYDKPLFISWGEMSATEYEELDYLVYGLTRGSVGMIAGVSNIGKSTFTRGAAIAMATGKPYLDVVKPKEEGKGLKVLLLDFETPKRKYQKELSIMTQQLNEEDQLKLNTNLYSYIAQSLDTPIALNLSREEDLKRVEAAAREHSADVIIIDTVSAAFEIMKENDNSEVTNRVMKPLQRLATELDCVVLIAHHIGKAGSEEGSQSNGLYRARGASAFVGLSHAVIQLDTKKTSSGEQVVTLGYAKVKDEKPDSAVIRFDPLTHWFLADDTTEAFSHYDANYYRFLDVIAGSLGETQTMRTREIVDLAVASVGVKRSTVENYITRAVNEDRIHKVGRGEYALPGYIPFEVTPPEDIALN